MDHFLGKLLSISVANIVPIGIGGITALLFGSWVTLMTTLLIVQGADIVTGFLKGTKIEDVGSRNFFKGLKKKVGMWILIILANVIDDIAFAGTPVAKTALVSFLIAGEGLSITENLAELGVPIPKFITKYLSQLRDNSDKIKGESDDSQ